ncbi:MAG: hypothetical protein WB679_15865, partial [Terracidiphilus sp.]
MTSVATGRAEAIYQDKDRNVLAAQWSPQGNKIIFCIGAWYESIFMQLLEKCQTETAAHSRRKFRFKNKLMSLDASIIELSATMFDWAKYTQQKGAIKLHLLLDHD